MSQNICTTMSINYISGEKKFSHPKNLYPLSKMFSPPPAPRAKYFHPIHQIFGPIPPLSKMMLSHQ